MYMIVQETIGLRNEIKQIKQVNKNTNNTGIYMPK